MIGTSLSLEDFARYFENNRLGRLYFPNGKCFTPNGEWFEDGKITQFHINLRDLYNLIIGWKINNAGISLDDVVGVIAFGSSVRHPGYRVTSKTGKKYLFFGPEITGKINVPIQPNDADFLVITGQDIIKEKVLKPTSLATYDCGTWITKGGIHLVNRGIHQILNSVRENDTISISAMREGVPIFYDGRLGEVQSRVGIKKETPRRLLWNKDEDGYLFGKIE